jgi:plastocyanin
VTLGDVLSSKRASIDIYADVPRFAPRKEAAAAGAEFANVVVYLERAPEGASPNRAPTAPAIAQERLSFTPHVLPIVKGTTVEFPNRDTLFHNVFSLSKIASFDLGRYPRGDSRSVTFPTPGFVKVFCHLHSNMSAVIVVLDNPFFATPDAHGRFTIDGIPPGEYRVVAWHERARRSVKKIRIRAGEAAQLDFDIPLAEEAPSDG